MEYCQFGFCRSISKNSNLSPFIQLDLEGQPAELKAEHKLHQGGLNSH